MAKIKHINCPKCGGTLGMQAVERLIECRYCRTWSLVRGAESTPEYYVAPKLGEVEARRRTQGALKDKDMPGGLIRETSFHSARLYFVPFHEMTGKRLGTMTVTDFKEPKASAFASSSSRSLQASYSSSGGIRFGDSSVGMKSLAPKETVVDTRVIMSDFSRNEPAVKLEAWAVDEAELAEVRADVSGALRPMDRKAMERLGRIQDPTITPEQILKKLELRPGTASLKDQTEYAEVKVKRIFYPIWRVRYRYQGRLYGASIDGVTGKLMTLRAPQDDRARVLWLLGTTSLVALILGRLIYGLIGLHILPAERVGPYLVLMAQGLTVIIPVFLFSLFLAIIVLGFGWEQFRYPGEIVIRGQTKTIEKINRPDQTVFDKLATLLGNILGEFLKARPRRGDF